MKYEVKWKNMWRSLTKYMAYSIIFSVTAVMIVRWLFSGFNYAETFQHLSFLDAIVAFLGCWVFSAIFAFLIAIFFSLAHITIENGNISGRNYWGRRKTFPLNSLMSIDIYSHNGVNAVIANGGSFGKVYIYFQTENIQEIVEILESHIPSKIEE